MERSPESAVIPRIFFFLTKNYIPGKSQFFEILTISWNFSWLFSKIILPNLTYWFQWVERVVGTLLTWTVKHDFFKVMILKSQFLNYYFLKKYYYKSEILAQWVKQVVGKTVLLKRFCPIIWQKSQRFWLFDSFLKLTQFSRKQLNWYQGFNPRQQVVGSLRA